MDHGRLGALRGVRGVTEALFPGYEPPSSVESDLSADRRRTKRQAEQVAAGIHPLTKRRLHPLASRHRDAASPKDDPYTCGTCWHRVVIRHHDRTYPKCVLGAEDRHASRMSHSATTDVRAWWPACEDYSPSDRLSPDAARSIP